MKNDLSDNPWIKKKGSKKRKTENEIEEQTC